MLNLNEDALKAAIVKDAAEQLLGDGDDLSMLVTKEVRARVDRIFADTAGAQIQAAIDEAIQTGFDREYQRVTAFGHPDGEKTSIRAELEKIVSGYWQTKVDPRSGTPSQSYNAVTRAEYLMTTICAKDFTETMKQSALSVTGALKDGLRNQLALVMDEILNDLFRVKSLQDQGKVKKPF